MGNTHAKTHGMVDSERVSNLAFLDEGQFAKIYTGRLVETGQQVAIKVPRVPEHIRKDRSEYISGLKVKGLELR